MALPFGILADRLGRKPILVLSILGSIMKTLWIMVVLSGTVPVRWFLAAPVFQMVGGGGSVMVAMLYSLAADAISEANRSIFVFSHTGCFCRAPEHVRMLTLCAESIPSLEWPSQAMWERHWDP